MPKKLAEMNEIQPGRWSVFVISPKAYIYGKSNPLESETRLDTLEQAINLARTAARLSLNEYGNGYSLLVDNPYSTVRYFDTHGFDGRESSLEKTTPILNGRFLTEWITTLRKQNKQEAHEQESR